MTLQPVCQIFYQNNKEFIILLVRTVSCTKSLIFHFMNAVHIFFSFISAENDDLN